MLLYIDPGSGSLLFQVLLSAFLTVIVFFKKALLVLKSLLARKQTSSMDNKNTE